MQKVYSRINWENEPSTNTPLSEDNLNKMDYSLNQIDDRVVQLYGYQDRVSQSEKNAKTSETNAKTSETNAKQSEVKAKEYMESAFKGTPEGYQEVVEKVDSMEIKTTKENTIKGTKNGGFRLTKFVANTIQNGTPSPITPIPMLSTGDCVDLAQGCYGVNGAINVDTEHVCCADHIPCKSGDVAKLEYGTTAIAIGLGFFDENNNLLSAPTVENTNTCEGTAPTGTKYMIFNIKGNGITPSNAGKITLTINGKYLNVVKTHGKNLIDISKTIPFAGGSVAIDGSLISINGQWYAKIPFLVEPNTDYCLSLIIGTSIVNSDFGIFDANNNKVGGYGTFNSGNNELLYLYLYSGTTDVGTTVYRNVQIEKGTVATEYEPYRETIACILTTYPMIKGSTLFRENGLVKAMHTTTQQVFNGDESIYIYPLSGENVERFYINVGTPKANLEVSYCSHLPFMAGNDDTPHYRWSSSGTVDDQIMMFIPKNLASTVDEFKAWLASNPVTVMWSITPIIETLDTQSQIALNGLKTFNGVTYVEFDSRVQPLEFEAEVGTSQATARLLKEELRNDTDQVERAELKKQLDELAVAIVALRS